MKLFEDEVKAFRLATLEKTALRAIATQLGLLELLGYFFKWNESTAEYHNNYHATCVALNCYEGACYEGLSESQTKTTVLAGIFHDFNHSGGTLTDDKNIERAVFGLSNAYTEEVIRGLGIASTLPKNQYLTENEFTETIQTLVVTKYPYEKTPTTKMQQIIRDADLMQPYEDNPVTLKLQYVGLHTEIERAFPMKFTAEEFAAGQLAWLDDHVVWYSSWAKEKAKVRNWNAVKQRLFDTINGN